MVYDKPVIFDCFCLGFPVLEKIFGLFPEEIDV